jgi:rod shape determining protein RodA
MVIFAASFCSSGKPLTLSRLLKFFFLVSFPLILIFRQPDLGNAIVYAVFFLAILFAGGAKPIFLLLTATVSTAILPIFWHLLKGYQRERILTFLSPTHDPLGAGYNAIQAEIAVGSGELFGRGLGRGTQSHLKFLPEFHTDFVFAAISEELGFLGSIITLLAFGFLLWQIIAIGQNSKDRFAYLISIGAFAQILIHVVINIGMNIGLVPITGITLPLVSYGGSSLISTMATLGIVANIHMTRSSRNA